MVEVGEFVDVSRVRFPSEIDEQWWADLAQQIRDNACDPDQLVLALDKYLHVNEQLRRAGDDLLRVEARVREIDLQTLEVCPISF